MAHFQLKDCFTRRIRDNAIQLLSQHLLHSKLEQLSAWFIRSGQTKNEVGPDRIQTFMLRLSDILIRSSCAPQVHLRSCLKKRAKLNLCCALSPESLVRPRPRPDRSLSPDSAAEYWAEARRLACYPNARLPDSTSLPAIERYDFPAPPSPAVVMIDKPRCTNMYDKIDFMAAILDLSEFFSGLRVFIIMTAR
ncbi:unnamed protein product [Echinostoma caproni]|uniref:Uncharacterized protein n=1 Tax=Echinostoma caproni TaxID=27848 RepID=A0A183AEQ1_9TREM|nr:unnamed protein product [Echinostoma caproni]